MLLTLSDLTQTYSRTDLLHNCNSLLTDGVDSLLCTGHNSYDMDLSLVPTIELEIELKKRKDTFFTHRAKGSDYEKLSINEMNNLLPVDSNWTFVKHDGYDIGDNGQRHLMVFVKCICGKQERKRWDRIKINRIVSCGCIFRRGTKEISMTIINGEQWKSVVGYEGLYEVSNLGRVKSLDKVVKRLTYSYLKKGRLMTDISDRYKKQNRYINICLRDANGIEKQTCIHRLVAQAFIPNPENKPVVNHKNGLKWDSRLENLEWVTEVENQQHALITGLKKSKKYNTI